MTKKKRHEPAKGLQANGEAWLMLVQSCKTGLKEQASQARKRREPESSQLAWESLIASIESLDVQAVRQAIKRGASLLSPAELSAAAGGILRPGRYRKNAYAAWLRAAKGAIGEAQVKAREVARALDEAGVPMMMMGSQELKDAGWAGGKAPRGQSLRRQRAASVREWANSPAWREASMGAAKACLTDLAAKWVVDPVMSQRLSREDWGSAIVESFAANAHGRGIKKASGAQMMEAFCSKFGEGLAAAEWADIFAQRSPLACSDFASGAFIRGAKMALRGRGRGLGAREAGALMEAACLADDVELLSLAAECSQSAPLRGAPQEWRGRLRAGPLASIALCGDMSRRAWGMWGMDKPRRLKCFEALMRISSYRDDFEEHCSPEALAFAGPRKARELIERFPKLGISRDDGMGVAFFLRAHFTQALEDWIVDFDCSDLGAADLGELGLPISAERYLEREGAELLAEARREPLRALFFAKGANGSEWEQLAGAMRALAEEYVCGKGLPTAWGKACALAEIHEIDGHSRKALPSASKSRQRI